MTGIDAETAALLREAAGKFAARAGGPAARRALRQTLPGLPPGHLAALAEQGWLAAILPEAAGGLGLGLDAAAILAESPAPAFLNEPLDSQFLAVRTLIHAGAAAAAFDGMAEGEALPVLAFQEGPDDIFAPETARTVLRDGRLTGTKTLVVGYAAATEFLISAQGPKGLVLARVPAGAEGMAVTNRWRADGTPVAGLVLERTPARLACADPAVARAALVAAVDEASLLVATELMARIDAVMALVLEHLKTRVQFGRPIGAFQALQHRAADLYVQQLLSRSVLEPAVAQIAAGMEPGPRARLVARVRARLNATARLAAREAIQMFGAMGITEDCDLSLHVRRILALTGWLGSEPQNRRRMAQALAAELRPASQQETAA